MEQVFWRVYQSFIESVDAVDNGIDQYDTTAKPRVSIVRCSRDAFVKLQHCTGVKAMPFMIRGVLRKVWAIATTGSVCGHLAHMSMSS